MEVGLGLSRLGLNFLGKVLNLLKTRSTLVGAERGAGQRPRGGGNARTQHSWRTVVRLLPRRIQGALATPFLGGLSASRRRMPCWASSMEHRRCRPSTPTPSCVPDQRRAASVLSPPPPHPSSPGMRTPPERGRLTGPLQARSHDSIASPRPVRGRSRIPNVLNGRGIACMCISSEAQW